MLWMVLNVVGHGDVVGDAVDGDDGIKYLALAGEWCSLLASRVVVAVVLHYHAYPDPRAIQTVQTRLQDAGLKHRKNCECCPVSLFIVRSLWL